jgi:hypothetical protein
MEIIKLVFPNMAEIAKKEEERYAALPKKKAVTSVRTYLHCPHCGEQTDATIDHIGPDKHVRRIMSFGPWYCNHCGCSYEGRWLEDGSIELALLEDKQIKTRDLVMVPANLPHPVFMVLEGMRFSAHEKMNAEIGQDVNDRTFFYESHSCPTRWIPNIDKMIYDGDTDPHGVIKFVRGVDVDKITGGDKDMDIHQALCDEELLREHFPETVVHEQFLDIVTTKDLEGEAPILAWVANNAPQAIREEYSAWLLSFTELLINENKMGDRWMMDYYLSKEKEGVRIVRAVAYPKDERKRTNKDGKKVFVMAKADLAIDENGKVFWMMPQGTERSGELED